MHKCKSSIHPGTIFVTMLFFVTMLCSLSVNAALTDQEIENAYYKSYNYEMHGDYSNAIKALALVHKTHPTTYTVNLRLGYLYLLNHNYANAQLHYQAAVKSAPSSISPQLGLMKISNFRGLYDKTEETGYRVLQKDYYNYYANLYLAFALRQSEKYEAAAQINLKMLEIYPSDISFLTEYGLTTYQQGDYEKAKRALQYVLILDPENVTAKETLPLALN